MSKSTAGSRVRKSLCRGSRRVVATMWDEVVVDLDTLWSLADHKSPSSAGGYNGYYGLMSTYYYLATDLCWWW